MRSQPIIYSLCPSTQHSLNRNDRFTLNYPHDSKNKSSRIEVPKIRLIQRLKDILNESPTKSMTLKQMVQSHNRKWPQYKTHEPNARSISIRFKSTFHIWTDDATKQQMIKIKAV